MQSTLTLKQHTHTLTDHSSNLVKDGDMCGREKMSSTCQQLDNLTHNKHTHTKTLVSSVIWLAHIDRYSTLKLSYQDLT